MRRERSRRRDREVRAPKEIQWSFICLKSLNLLNNIVLPRLFAQLLFQLVTCPVIITVISDSCAFSEYIILMLKHYRVFSFRVAVVVVVVVVVHCIVIVIHAMPMQSTQQYRICFESICNDCQHYGDISKYSSLSCQVN